MDLVTQAKFLSNASVIVFSSWLSQKCPDLAGFIIALPLASLLALALAHLQHSDAEKSIAFGPSIFLAVPVSHLFFIPFLYPKLRSLGFGWPMDWGCLYWLLAISFNKRWSNDWVERQQQQTPFNRIFEEQLHENTVSKNRVDGTNPYAFCTNFCTKLVDQIFDIVDLIIYFCAIKIVRVSPPAPFSP